jgi:hypothetical protein
LDHEQGLRMKVFSIKKYGRKAAFDFGGLFHERQRNA